MSKKFYKTMMKISADSLERFSESQRDNSSLIQRVNPERIQELKALIRELQNKLIETEPEIKDSNQIMYIGFHAIPLTDVFEDGD